MKWIASEFWEDYVIFLFNTNIRTILNTPLADIIYILEEDDQPNTFFKMMEEFTISVMKGIAKNKHSSNTVLELNEAMTQKTSNSVTSSNSEADVSELLKNVTSVLHEYERF